MYQDQTILRIIDKSNGNETIYSSENNSPEDITIVQSREQGKLMRGDGFSISQKHYVLEHSYIEILEGKAYIIYYAIQSR